jgi:hypothetical protein
MPKTRDAELARLLEEVRALRGDLEVLKRNPIIRDALGAAGDLPPNYAVAVRPIDRAAGELPPNYAVLVRPGPDIDRRLSLPPNYAVVVRPVPDREAVIPGAFERSARGRTTARKAATVTAAARKAKPRKRK